MLIKLLRKIHCLWLYNHKKWESKFLFFISGQKFLNAKVLASYKNKFAGKRCFIVCNGPSLRVEDLDLLHDRKEYTFGCNWISKIFPNTRWRPTFYSMMDEGGMFDLYNVMNEVPGVHFYRSDSYLVTRNIASPCVWVNVNGDRKLLESPKFSKEADHLIYAIGTITFAMLELASYMGFSKIYIIGCDNKFGLERKKDGTVVYNNVASHFKEAQVKNDVTTASGTWEMNIAYACARKASDESPDFTIYNATRGGHLEAFERVDFDSLFN